MKYFYFLLFCFSLCSAQKYDRVTAYKIVNEHDDSPCSVAKFVKYATEFGEVFTAESTDQTMIKNLLAVKKNAKKYGKKSKFYCHERMIGGDMIDNMFVFEGATNDTLFTTNYNHLIVFPHKDIAYTDNDFHVNKALTGDMKAFYERDFVKELRPISRRILDSVTFEKIIYCGKIAKNINSEYIKSKAKEFKLIDIDTIGTENSEKYSEEYSVDNNIVKFDTDRFVKSITATNKLLTIDGIAVGDSENVITSKYPLSAKVPYPNGTTYEEIKHNYEYTIYLAGGKGAIFFKIKNKVITEITIDFDWEQR